MLMDSFYSGGDTLTDLRAVLRTLHEYPLVIPAPLCPSEVLVLAFLLTQVCVC